MNYFLSALSEVFQLQNLLLILAGTLAGIIVGAIPGLTAIMGLSLLIPFTIAMDGPSGILLLLGMFCGAIYGGSITAILINTPGTANSAATALDGYPLAQKGQADRALSISTTASVFGGIFSALMLFFTAPLLGKVASSFTSVEYFALAFFGISMVTGIASKNLLKGLIGAVLGMLLAVIGSDNNSAELRFTFDSVYLMSGISMIPILIALYAFTQGLSNVESQKDPVKADGRRIRRIFPTWADIKRTFFTILRSSIIGTLIGAIPGTGGDIASWIGYNEAKRWAKDPEQFGKGDIRGVAAPEAANNAVSGGALIPLLTLGIPGDAGTAIMLSALMFHGITPGPLLFTEQGDKQLVYLIILGLLLANIAMGVFGFLGIRLFSRISDVSNRYLTPIIFIFCTVGTFAINNSLQDVFLMFGVGVLAFFLLKLGFPMPPIVLGLILGDMLEDNLRKIMVTQKGDLSVLFDFSTHPIAAVLMVVSLISLLLPVVLPHIRRALAERRAAKAAK